MNLPSATRQIITSGVNNAPEFIDHQGDLWVAVVEEFNRQPDECTDGGNDKHFFSMTFQGVKLFVAENEVGGLTIMKPEEY